MSLDNFNMSINKVIHYCWFGRKPLPTLALKCIASWKKYLPDYDIKEWNEDNFDVNSVSYTKEAYQAKKYAFVSDYARYWILYHYGGIYFDTDVEVIKPLDTIIEQGPFMGCENVISNKKEKSFLFVNPGLGIGVYPHHSFYKEMLDLYATIHFIDDKGNLNLKTIVIYTTDLLKKHGLRDEMGIQNVEGINIYPAEFFSPISVEDGKLRITENTYTIHHFAQSWQSPLRIYARRIVLLVGGKRLKSFLKKFLIKK